ncbi:MAG TPA: hypothetical protein VJ695_05430 [Nitrososphaera sp.]|nr:hypothetical protein [Nitrososphaera sp.]
MIILIVIINIIPTSAQQRGGQAPSSASSLFIALFANGDSLVEQNVVIEDPLAEQIRIKLFGDDISDLVVADFEDNSVEFNRGETPSEIVVNRPNASNLKISYTTSDFLSKDRREWIFSINSTVSLSVKLPPDSILTDPGQNPSIVLVGDQQLLTYKPGNIRFVYVIGTLGTEEQANIVIKAAETTMVQIKDSYPGIVLTSANDLLQRAINARDDSRFTEAEKLADQANDAAIATGREYGAAQQALANAEARMNSAAGTDNTAIAQILAEANNQFAIGNYTQAVSTVQSAVTALDDRSSGPVIPLWMIIMVIVASLGVAGGIGAMIFLRKRSRSRPVPQLHTPDDIPKTDTSNSDNRVGTSAIFRRPSHSLAPVGARREVSEVEEQQGVVADSVGDNTISAMPTTSISNSQVDGTVLRRIVSNILTEKPHLRPEDQQVLKFLAENGGAVFESEIRSKFQIPKTTIWRLVKRLEREELIEIRKAGGQNLIKLKFEDKQA